jgi:hypothetical protein
MPFAWLCRGRFSEPETTPRHSTLGQKSQNGEIVNLVRFSHSSYFQFNFQVKAATRKIFWIFTILEKIRNFVLSPWIFSSLENIQIFLHSPRIAQRMCSMYPLQW